MICGNAQTVTTWQRRDTKKIYDKYNTRVTEIIYTLWHGLYVHVETNFLFTWFDEVDLGHETQSVPRHCAKHIPQVTNQHRHASSTNKKTKVINKKLIVLHRTQQHQWRHYKQQACKTRLRDLWHCSITHSLSPHKLDDIKTKPCLR
jgi:hypothetical protein